MHCTVEDNTGGQGEFLVRGQAMEVNSAKMREEAFEHAKIIGYNPQERYVLFELRITEALSTIYENGHPKTLKWKAG